MSRGAGTGGSALYFGGCQNGCSRSKRRRGVGGQLRGAGADRVTAQGGQRCRVGGVFRV